MQGRGIVELVEDLHRLELDDARAGEPGQDDVLHQLVVRAGGGPHRRRGAAAVEAHRGVERRIAAEELLLRQVEDLPFALVLQQRAPGEPLERERNQLGHYAVGASVC